MILTGKFGSGWQDAAAAAVTAASVIVVTKLVVVEAALPFNIIVAVAKNAIESSSSVGIWYRKYRRDFNMTSPRESLPIKEGRYPPLHPTTPVTFMKVVFLRRAIKSGYMKLPTHRMNAVGCVNNELHASGTSTNEQHFYPSPCDGMS